MQRLSVIYHNRTFWRHAVHQSLEKNYQRNERNPLPNRWPVPLHDPFQWWHRGRQSTGTKTTKSIIRKHCKATRFEWPDQGTSKGQFSFDVSLNFRRKMVRNQKCPTKHDPETTSHRFGTRRWWAERIPHRNYPRRTHSAGTGGSSETSTTRERETDGMRRGETRRDEAKRDNAKGGRRSAADPNSFSNILISL